MSAAFRATVGSLEIDKDALRIYARICLVVLGVNVTAQVEVEIYGNATPDYLRLLVKAGPRAQMCLATIEGDEYKVGMRRKLIGIRIRVGGIAVKAA